MRLEPQFSVGKIIYNQDEDIILVKLSKVSPLKRSQKVFVDFEEEKPVIVESKDLAEKYQEMQTVKDPNQITLQLNQHPQVEPLTQRVLSVDFQPEVPQSELNQSSVINHEEEPQRNNETVLSLLDDMVKQRVTLEKKKKSKSPPKRSLSPKTQAVARRKQYAVDGVTNKEKQEAAKHLIAKLSKQRQDLEQKRIIDQHNRSEFIEETIEDYTQQRHEMVEQFNQEKRDRIKQRLEQMQQQAELKKQLNENQKLLIMQVKHKMKLEQEALKMKLELEQSKEINEINQKLNERKKLAQPIRISEINQHAEKYMENLNRLQLEKNQIKLEREIKIQQETKQIYKPKSVLDEVLKADHLSKAKDQIVLQEKKQLLRRKIKYAEIIKEQYRPSPQKSELEKIQQSKILQVKDNDMSRDEFVDFLKQARGSSLTDKNISKIKGVLSHQSLPKTHVTELLKQGKVPKMKKLAPIVMEDFVEMDKQRNMPKPKHMLYLQEMAKERQSKTLHPNQPITFKAMNQTSQLRQMQKMEEDARRKEEIAQINKDEKLYEEVAEIYIKNIKAKLAFLDKNI